MNSVEIEEIELRTPYISLLPARASEQGNVIGSVSVYIYIIYICHQKKIVIERSRDLIWINRQERLQSRNELTRETKRHESSYKSSRVRQNQRSNNVIKNGYNKARAMTFG